MNRYRKNSRDQDQSPRPAGACDQGLRFFVFFFFFVFFLHKFTSVSVQMIKNTIATRTRMNRIVLFIKIEESME